MISQIPCLPAGKFKIAAVEFNVKFLVFFFLLSSEKILKV